MKGYRVAKNIPVPEPRGRRSLYEFPALEVGESILVTSKSEVYACRKRMRNKGQDVVSRKMGEDSWRIWRSS